MTRIEELQPTGMDCPFCEDVEMREHGHEKVCPSCSFVLGHEFRPEPDTPWERHRKQVHARAYGDSDGRPRLVGGYVDAYHGEGSYSFGPAGFER